MLDFYQSTEFRTYRKHLIRTLVDYIRLNIDTKEASDFWKVKGALELARRIFEVPMNDVPNGDSLRRYAREDMDAFIGTLVRDNMVQ